MAVGVAAAAAAAALKVAGCVPERDGEIAWIYGIVVGKRERTAWVQSTFKHFAVSHVNPTH